MIRALHAHTIEIDDPAAALAALRAQLALEANLLRHAVGILTCHRDFVHNGVAAAVCDALPFDVVGVTTTGQAVRGVLGIASMTLLVLTSDDVSFSAACTPSLSQGLADPIRAAYQRARASLSGAPALMLTFAPLLLAYAGDQYVEALDAASGGVPNFGTLSMDDTDAYDQCYTIFNGDCARDTLALVLLEGKVHPRFYVTTVTGKNIINQTAVITQSSGNLLQSLGGQPPIVLLESLGLASRGVIRPGLNFLVCLIDHRDGTPLAGKVLIGLNARGEGICGGYMPKGSNLLISTLDKEDVLATTGKLIAALPITPRDSVLLSFSCNTRSIALGADPNAEFGVVEAGLSGRLPYLLSLSGGEICPVTRADGQLLNRFHNNSFVACLL